MVDFPRHGQNFELPSIIIILKTARRVIDLCKAYVCGVTGGLHVCQAYDVS